MTKQLTISRSCPQRWRVLRLAAVLLAVSMLAAPAARADDVKPPWQPKAPDGLPAEFDWIRLPSDEWLKGEIISMYDGKLEFDSDELGVHTFDFADIKEIRTSRVVQVGFADADRKAAMGRLVLDGKNARVIGETGETAFGRAEILTIVVGAAREIDYWSGYANVGGNIRSGNSDQVDYTARLGTVRRSVKNRTVFDYFGTITRIDSRGHLQQPPGDPRLGPLPGPEAVPEPGRPRVVPRPVPEHRRPLDGHRGPRLRDPRHRPHVVGRDRRSRLAVQHVGQRSARRRGVRGQLRAAPRHPLRPRVHAARSTSTPTTTRSSPTRRPAPTPTTSTPDSRSSWSAIWISTSRGCGTGCRTRARWRTAAFPSRTTPG